MSGQDRVRRQNTRFPNRNSAFARFVGTTNDVSLLPIVASALLVPVFFYFWWKAQYRYALFAVLLLGMLLRTFMVGDRSLHTWDERFHANVAKHIWAHPGTPTLYNDPVLPYNYHDWSSNHVWLSKPVLPFWIVGASIEAFGNNEIGLRLPGVLLSLLSVWLTYRIGRRLCGERTAVLAAFLHAVHGLTLESAGGLVSSDHVDTVFTTCCYTAIYLTLTHLSLPPRGGKDRRSDPGGQPYLIGAMIGLAFLSKWIAAFLLGPIVLGFYAIASGGWQRFGRDVIPIAATALAVALPWPIYLWVQHPVEARYIAEQLLFPVGAAIQGHGGGPLYYLNEIRIVFGELIYLPLGWLLYRGIYQRDQVIRVLLVWLFPLLLLSFAGTKRSTYLLLFAPAFFLLTAVFIDFLRQAENWPRLPAWLRSGLVLLLIALPLRYSVERIKPLRPRFVLPPWRVEMARFAEGLELSPDQILLYDEPRAFDAMFFYGITAYPYTPDTAALNAAHRRGYHIYRNTGGRYERRHFAHGKNH